MTVVPFESLEEKAFRAFADARDRALATGDREDARLARRLFAVFCETGIPIASRWPRDPETLRILAPSEMRGRQ